MFMLFPVNISFLLFYVICLEMLIWDKDIQGDSEYVSDILKGDFTGCSIMLRFRDTGCREYFHVIWKCRHKNKKPKNRWCC